MKKHTIIIWVFMIVMLTTFVNASFCYQESANVSTTCGSLSTNGTGTYAILGDYNSSYAGVNGIDGDWNTFARTNGFGTNGYVLVNYSKPSWSTIASFWQVKSTSLGIVNKTIPSACWVQDVLQFNITSSWDVTHGQGAGFYCYNGTRFISAWTQFTTTTDFYEEGMQWSDEIYSNLTIRLTNSLNGSTVNDFSVYVNNTLNGSTTSGVYSIRFLLDSSNYSIKVSSLTNANVTSIITTNVSSQDLNLSSLPFTRLNISLRDTLTGQIVNNYTVYVNGTLNGNTTNGYYLVNYLLNATNYNITATSSTNVNAYSNFFVNLTNTTYRTLNLTALPDNSLNFTFYYENNLSKITKVVVVEIINEYFTYNSTTSNGTLFVGNVPEGIYNVRYGNTSLFGSLRSYDFELEPASFYNINLYLLPNASSSGNVQVVVYDGSTLLQKEGAIVYLQKYNLNSNSYDTMATYVTDIGGNSYFSIVDTNTYYRFVVDYPVGTTRLATNRFLIQSDLINLYVNFADSIAENFYNIEGIVSSITYDNATLEFTANYNDVENVATSYCLYIKEHGRYANQVINSTCGTSNSGAFALSHPASDGTYYAVLTATIDGEELIVQTAWTSFDTEELPSGTLGLFFTAVIVILFAFVSPVGTVALILASLGLLFAKLLGLILIGWGYVSLIFIMSMILAIMIEVKRRA